MALTKKTYCLFQCTHANSCFGYRPMRQPFPGGRMGSMTQGALTCKCPGVLSRMHTLNQPTKQCADVHRANDEGLFFYKRGEHGKAFHSFTEAIRLHPSTATYHANRSAAALKLQLFGTALQDARYSHAADSPSYRCCFLGSNDRAFFQCRMAIKRDPAYLKAHLRAADALQKLGRPQEALHAYQTGQRISPSNPSVQVQYK